MQPIKPNNVDEAAAEPTAVDYPEQSRVIELPADTTESPGVEDTGYVWDQTFPRDTEPMPRPDKPVMIANRVTEVSDRVIFGAAEFVPNTPPQLLVTAHRDRLRVTLQSIPDADGPYVYLGHGPDITPGFSAWSMLDPTPIVLRTRGAIWAATGAGTGTIRIQWAIEMVAEGCGCPTVGTL